jgi:hypothetical protein
VVSFSLVYLLRVGTEIASSKKQTKVLTNGKLKLATSIYIEQLHTNTPANLIFNGNRPSVVVHKNYFKSLPPDIMDFNFSFLVVKNEFSSQKSYQTVCKYWTEM